MNIVEQYGGEIVKSAQNTSWGRLWRLFQDPDGYYWEVAYGEMWHFDKNDILIIE